MRRSDFERSVEKHGLGGVYHPRAVIRFEGSEAEPDLMVRVVPPGVRGNAWEKLPPPLLVVEMMSPTTRRRDLVNKREYYIDAGVGEYWVVDGEGSEITVIRRGANDVVARESLVWRAVAAEPLAIDVASTLGRVETAPFVSPDWTTDSDRATEAPRARRLLK